MDVVWQMYGVVGIGVGDCFSSRDFGKFFICGFQLTKYGGCSLVAERSVVVRMARVRFSASALVRNQGFLPTSC